MTPGCGREVTWIRRPSLLRRWPYPGWQQMPEAKVTSLALCPGLDCVHCFVWHQAKPRFKLCCRGCQNLAFPATSLRMPQSDCCDQNLAAKLCQLSLSAMDRIFQMLGLWNTGRVSQPYPPPCAVRLSLIVYALVKVGKGSCTHGWVASL